MPKLPNPKRPVFRFGVVHSTQRKIEQDAGYEFHNDQIVGRRVGEFAQAVAVVLGKKYPLRAITASVTAQLLGRDLTQALLTRFAWRLAGNLDALAQGRTIGSEVLIVEPTWVPYQIMQATPGLDRYDRANCDFKLQALAGVCCPDTRVKSWSRKACGVLSQRFGYSAPWDDRPYSDPAQLVGLRFFALVIPPKPDRAPDFDSIEVAASMWDYNRKVIDIRSRVVPCPRNHAYACHRCAVGRTGRDGCPASTHPLDYVRGACEYCHHDNAYFDPSFSVDHCIDCFLHFRMRKSEK